MKKRLLAFLLTIPILCLCAFPSLACDENQTQIYVLQMLYGDDATSHESDLETKMLLDAIYLCCEQSDGLGKSKLQSLVQGKVWGIPKLADIDIKSENLTDCSHKSWEYEYVADKKTQRERKSILKNTINKIYDFGLINSLFGVNSGKCNSFAAILYYSHILADYLSDNPLDTEVSVKGLTVGAYSGEPYVTVNGNRPSFTTDQKKSTIAFSKNSQMDSMGRCGTAIANVGPENMPPSNSRQEIGMIKPTGWNQQKYQGVVNSDPPFIYNRCHLIAHQLIGNDSRDNLITGTRYLNETGMQPFEDKVADYIKETGNHVLYRVTPVFVGENLLASGVQLEAYSVEDAGEGISFNVYCYNVQPGVSINYRNGQNELNDSTLENDEMIPFAILNASQNNPDLIFEMSKHLEILFAEQKGSNVFTSMMGEINVIANEARNVGNKGEKPAKQYIILKNYEYKYFEILRNYIPKLLQNEKFFTSD